MAKKYRKKRRKIIGIDDLYYQQLGETDKSKAKRKHSAYKIMKDDFIKRYCNLVRDVKIICFNPTHFQVSFDSYISGNIVDEIVNQEEE